MASIALICEGASEVKMLTYIVTRYLGDEIVVNAIQPALTQKGRQATEGGWLEVLNHCNDDTINAVFATNDYLVIQIDTDTCAQINYDVNIYDENNRKVGDSVLYERVKSRLLKDLSTEIQTKYADRILFAICINETECWLLPLYYENDAKKRCATTNCIFILNQRLQTEGIGIPDKEKNTPEAIQVYNKVLKKLKKKDIPQIAQYNYGFQKFVEQMDGIIVSFG
jgi:hypothetical protein